jgi:hypothetical protein
MSRIFKKREKCSVRKNLKSCFLVFFLFTFFHNHNLLCFNKKKDIHLFIHIRNKLKKCFPHEVNLSIQKKLQQSYKIFLMFFLCSVRSTLCAIIGGNLAPIGAYSRTAQNRRKWATIYRRVRHYRDIRNNMYSTPPPLPPSKYLEFLDDKTVSVSLTGKRVGMRPN